MVKNKLRLDCILKQTSVHIALNRFVTYVNPIRIHSICVIKVQGLCSKTSPYKLVQDIVIESLFVDDLFPWLNLQTFKMPVSYW